MTNIYNISKKMKALRTAKANAKNPEFKALWEQKISEYELLVNRQSTASDYLLATHKSDDIYWKLIEKK